MGVCSLLSFSPVKFLSLLTIMRTRLIWVAPDFVSLRYNNAVDILQRIAHFLSKYNHIAECIIYIYTTGHITSIKTFYQGVPVNYVSSPFTLFRRSSQYALNIFFFDSYRLPDKLSLLWNNIRKPVNVKTIYIQHGRYTKLNRRYISTHILKKTFFYLIFLFKTFFHIPLPVLKLFLLKSHIFVDFAFIYSPFHYWNQFHNMHGMFFESSYLIHDRDMNRFSLNPDSTRPEKKSFLYIVQTLVEDGRCSKSDFLVFWRSLVDFSIRNGFCIDIRLHPRSNRNFWHTILSETSEVQLNVISATEFIRYNFVITHNSAMAVFFLNNSIPVCFFGMSAESLPLGLESHPYAHCFDNSTNIYESLLPFQNRFIDVCTPPSVSIEKDLPNPSEMVRQVDLEAKLEELTLSLLKSSTF